MKRPGTIAEVALEMIRDGQVVGLGSGRAARSFVEALGARVGQGLKICGVPTSRETAELASRCGVPLTTLDEVNAIDVTFDGADEVDPQLDLIKGWGGALVREKIVAAASKTLVILVGPEKLVDRLGTRGMLPVEVVPFGRTLCRRKISELGFASQPRAAGDALFVTDNGNHILDCQVMALTNPRALEAQLLSIPGVVGTGLFLGMADTVLVQEEGQVDVRHRLAQHK
ncbi:MAG: ribose-5-phosphate isomerase RpiA [Planctomycetia bacterium]|nr:ribose-5-phosphate isomerase RpiA [Planctomycetia bacterium]